MKSFITLLVLFFACTAHASQEGILALSRFQLESEGIGTSGKIIIVGKQDGKQQLTALNVTAFGKVFVLPKEQLTKIAELPSNGIRISYEHGYAEIGGRTIYIHLQMGFTSFTRKQALITLTENGKFEVGDIQQLKEPDYRSLAVPESTPSL